MNLEAMREQPGEPRNSQEADSLERPINPKMKNVRSQ